MPPKNDSIRFVLFAIALASSACSGSSGSDTDSTRVRPDAAVGNDPPKEEEVPEVPDPDPDAGVVVPEGCQELADGEEVCTGENSYEDCRDGERRKHLCSPGSLCEPEGPGAVHCVCDNVADGICPGSLCLKDIDCAVFLPTCDGAQATYQGLLGGSASATALPTFVSLTGQLNSDPDFFSLTGLLPLSTGIVREWGETDPWKAFINLDVKIVDGEPVSVSLPILSGMLDVNKVDGQLAAVLANAVFVDNLDTPTCSARVKILSFDVPIQ